MSSKKIFAVLVIAAMALAMLPAMTASALAVPTLSSLNGAYGTTIKVTGAANDAPAGTLVELYIDDTTIAWNAATGKGKLNSTTADASGNYEVWFDVPSCPAGVHTIWVKAVATNTLSSKAFTVLPKVKVSPSTGTTGDVVNISFYGFKKNVSLVYLVVNGSSGAAPYTGTPVAAETIDTGDASTIEFTGFVAQKPIVIGTVLITHAGAEIAADGGDGKLYNALLTEIGTIDYATGEYDITWTVPPPVGAISAAYQYYEDNDATYTWGPSSTSTNALGYSTGTFEIPAGIDNGAYAVAAFDNVGNTAGVAVNKGPAISVSSEATASGKMVRVNGRGWNSANTIASIKLERPGYSVVCPINFPAYPVTIETDGSWFADVYIPDAPKVKDDYTIKATDSGAITATADYEITALTKVTVSPEFGAQGSTVTVSGVNYMNTADVTIAVQIGATALGNAKTKSDGSWSKTFTVPAIASATYSVTGTDAVNGYVADADYKVGNMLIMLNPVKGNAGSQVTLTGYGFTANKQYNVTIGTKTVVKSTQGAVSATGTVTKTFNVPQLAAGVYTVKVTDCDSGIALTTTFTVEETTNISFSPNPAPNLYRVTVLGSGFYSTGAANSTITFKIYNETSPGVIAKWYNIAVKNDWGAFGTATVNSTGYVTAIWDVDADTILSKGAYKIEAKDAQGYTVTVPFTVGAAHVVAAPRKASFRPGETLSFNLEHSLGLKAPYFGSYLRVYNPSGALVFDGDALLGWIKVNDYYVAPYSIQTASANPMLLPDDAPTGTWTWKWLKAGSTTKTVATGSFTVSTTGGTVDPAITDLKNDIDGLKTTVAGIQTSVDNKINALSTDVAGVKTDVAAVKTAVQTEVAALKSDITGVKTDVAGVKTAVQADINAVKTAVQTDISGVKTDLGTVKTNVAATQTAVDATSKAVASLATSVAAVNTAAANAATAAKAAQDGVSGLQTLVYGAIGASLIAAAAAIVALMQISRKIA